MTSLILLETSGYPTTKDGFIESEAFEIGFNNGRGCFSDDKKPVIFTELASELESLITSSQNTIGALTTQGVSVSDELALLTFRDSTHSV